MCGIVGWWARPDTSPAVVERTCDAMAGALFHRGPDAGGTWLDHDHTVALGHRRLAVLDLSDAGRQPMASVSGRYMIVFNGEIYNHLAMRDALAEAGSAPSWRGHSDTETLLAMLDAWGLSATLAKISGMFAFGLWDRRDGRLSLARDRMGEKPLYYCAVDGHVWFASELKAFRQCDRLDLAIDRDAAALYFRYGYVPTPRTIFRNVHKIPPGCFVTAPRETFGDAAPTTFWSLESVVRSRNPRETLPLAQSVDALDALLGRTVRAQMLSDAPLGAFLSGGIDSSLITALMAAGSARKVQSFSIGFGDEQFNEAVHARAVAKHLGTEHTEVILTEQDALNVVPDLPDMFDEPFADSSQIPTALLCRMARTRVTVALSGDGGDELFGGYNRYLFAPKLWDRFSALPAPLRRVLARWLTLLPTEPKGALGRSLATGAAGLGLHAGQVRKLARYGAILSNSADFNDVFRQLVEEWPRSQSIVIDAESVPTRLDHRENWIDQLGREEGMMALDATTYLPDDILVKVDRSAMAASLETRAPFLDPDVVAFAWNLPLEQKIHGGRGKQILRSLLDRYVPRALIDRPKQGFAIPLDSWLRGPLREWADDLLDPAALAADGLLRPQPIVDAWQDHRSGRRQLGSRVWTALMFQAWKKRFFDEQPRQDAVIGNQVRPSARQALSSAG